MYELCCFYDCTAGITYYLVVCKDKRTLLQSSIDRLFPFRFTESRGDSHIPDKLTLLKTFTKNYDAKEAFDEFPELFL